MAAAGDSAVGPSDEVNSALKALEGTRVCSRGNTGCDPCEQEDHFLAEWPLECQALRTHLLQPGVSTWRTAAGVELPVAESPMLEGNFWLRGFLHKSQGDVDAAWTAIQAMLMWRQTTLPSAAEAELAAKSHAAHLLKENRRFRQLAVNRDGDLVYVMDSCWGHFVTEDASELELLRMMILGVEAAVNKADAAGHPQLVVISFGGASPCSWSQATIRVLQANYPCRLKRAVVYPVPYLWASVAYASLFFMDEETRAKVWVVSEEAEVVDAARLVGPEQLPEDWRGGFDGVTARHKPDTSLLESLVMEYLNPFGDSGTQLEADLAKPWGAQVIDAGAEHAVTPEEDDSQGYFSWLGL